MSFRLVSGSWCNRELILNPFDTGCLLGSMLSVFRDLARRGSRETLWSFIGRYRR
jgi:hypothetical protein